jgi:5-methyltetrahydropteroyltriglutamate--homocysteine methyltransferase
MTSSSPTDSAPPFKADVVGSLLRPPEVHEARRKCADGEISAEEQRAVEDAAIREAVAMQREVGLKVATDGEFHRRHWFLDFLEKIDGIEMKGGLPVKFHNEAGEIEFSPPRFEVTGRIGRSRSLAGDDYAFLHSLAAGITPKQAIPSPAIVHFRGGRAAISSEIYPDIEDFFEDLAQVYREEIAALYELGCRYLQIDETNLPFLCDPALREQARSIGEDPDTLPAIYTRLINQAVRDAPDDMTICMHMCRGNHESSWVAEGAYDPVAEVAFGEMDIDGFFLEYDSPRAGGFEPLRYLTGNKVAVLGLVTTKKPDLEAKDAVKRRIEEAARIVPVERLALSPQCGFASTIGGNALTIEDEKQKLRLVVEIAEEVWGTA